MRQLDTRQPFADKQIQVIQCARFHVHQHMIVAQSGIRHFFILKNFRTAKFMEANSFHSGSLLTQWETSEIIKNPPRRHGDTEENWPVLLGSLPIYPISKCSRITILA